MRRAGSWAVRRIWGTSVARGFGSGWHAIVRAVGDQGRSLIDEPEQTAGVGTFELDEPSVSAAQRQRSTSCVAGLADVGCRRLLDVVEGAPGTPSRAD